MVATASQTEQNQPLFTCLSCSIAFTNATEQRIHYRSDHHRYNMKRRVASLPPISEQVFSQKVSDRIANGISGESARRYACETCGKAYVTEKAYDSHTSTKKHREAQSRVVRLGSTNQLDLAVNPSISQSNFALKASHAGLLIDEQTSPEEISDIIDRKVGEGRSQLTSDHCLFCPEISQSMEINLAHMSSAHSFFIPDTDYLIDIRGLLTYLGEKLAVGNVCIYCNDKGRAFRTLDAVRKHMLDKSHCKIAYEAEIDRLEVSDFYDFTSSYPEARGRQKGKEKEAAEEVRYIGHDEWEDLSDDELGSTTEVFEGSDSDSDAIPESEIVFDDTQLQLVLPSGMRIGHRSTWRYHSSSASPQLNKSKQQNSNVDALRELLADKTSALVPRKGGFGAFGAGTDVVKARNRGEAREAGRHVREYRDQKRREEFRTRVAFIHNNQKHYRDPLLGTN